MEDQLSFAIQNKLVVSFVYKGHPRICEPHIRGSCNAKRQGLFYQIGGTSSSGGLPQFRRMDLAGISKLQVLGRTFLGKRPYPSGKHSSWDQIDDLVG